MERDKNDGGYNSRELLKKKVIDRWENEGGKLSAEGIKKTPESNPRRKPKRKKNAPSISQG